MEKARKYDEHPHRLCKSESSLLSNTSISPPLHAPMVDSTTLTHLDHDVNSETLVSPHKYEPMNFSSVYHPSFSSNPLYNHNNSYTSDATSMMYNSAYSYMNPPSVPMPATSSPIHFPPYGYYPTNNYHASFF